MPRMPIQGEMVEIYEEVKGQHCLIMHVVICTSVTKRNKKTGIRRFRCLHYPNGKLCIYKQSQINRILKGEEADEERNRYKHKKRKVATYEH